MCMHDGLDEVCPGRSCICPCDGCVLGFEDDLDDDFESEEEVQDA